jgi:hypothetical protein
LLCARLSLSVRSPSSLHKAQGLGLPRNKLRTKRERRRQAVRSRVEARASLTTRAHTCRSGSP